MSENKDIKSKELYSKGESAFNKGNYQEALHYFNLSNKMKSDLNTFNMMNICKIKISEKEKEYSNKSSTSSETNNNNNNKKEEENEKDNTNNNNDNNNNENNENAQNEENNSTDIECEIIIKCNDYYKVLDLEKNASNEELKKSYKKKQ